jgi:hypothetical protein
MTALLTLTGCDSAIIRTTYRDLGYSPLEFIGQGSLPVLVSGDPFSIPRLQRIEHRCSSWAYQCLMWLRNGIWTPLPIELIWRYNGFADPDLQWKGAQIIAAGILDLPIALVSILIACLLFWPEYKVREAWARWDKKIDEELRDIRTQEREWRASHKIETGPQGYRSEIE